MDVINETENKYFIDLIKNRINFLEFQILSHNEEIRKLLIAAYPSDSVVTVNPS